MARGLASGFASDAVTGELRTRQRLGNCTDAGVMGIAKPRDRSSPAMSRQLAAIIRARSAMP